MSAPLSHFYHSSVFRQNLQTERNYDHLDHVILEGSLGGLAATCHQMSETSLRRVQQARWKLLLDFFGHGNTDLVSSALAKRRRKRTPHIANANHNTMATITTTFNHHSQS
jgi:hypothetical protein